MSKDSPLTKDSYSKNSKIYKVLSNPKRLEILNILADNDEASVEELTEIIGARKANISQHLSILRMNDLVKTRRDGQYIYYSIVDPKIVSTCRVLHDLRTKKVISNFITPLAISLGACSFALTCVSFFAI